jgi:hypothetical protein
MLRRQLLVMLLLVRREVPWSSMTPASMCQEAEPAHMVSLQPSNVITRSLRATIILATPPMQLGGPLHMLLLHGIHTIPTQKTTMGKLHNSWTPLLPLCMVLTKRSQGFAMASTLIPS